MGLIALNNPLLETYFVYSAILVLKVLFLSVLTRMTRSRRVRRAHRNDLENIPFFFVIGFLYILTGPSVWLAILLFRLYTAFRFTYTFAQPAPTLGFMIPLFIKWYMGVSVAVYFAAGL